MLIRKKYLLHAILTVFVCVASVGTAHASDPAGAKKFISNVSDRIIGIIKAEKKSDSDKEKGLVNIFKQSVDSEWMGKFVLGRYYRQANQAQKTKYLSLYSDFLVQSYVPRFKSYAGEEFSILDVKSKGDGQYIVVTELRGVSAESQPIRVDYRLKQLGNKGKRFSIIDVIGEGISLITTQRSDFSGIISKKGIDEFLNKLEKRVKKFNSAVKVRAK